MAVVCHHASGLFYFLFSVVDVEMAMAVAETMDAVTIVVFGLFYF